MSVITVTFHSGTKAPALAWGCGSGKAKKNALESGKVALDAGFRHIDTAQGYNTEEAVGELVASHNLVKDDVFVTSKRTRFIQLLPLILNTHHGLFVVSARESDAPVPLDEVRSEIEASIKRLGFTPDLFLIHNPFVVPDGSLKKTWQLLEDLKDEGVLKDIGVSNFRPQDLKLILDGAKHIPVTNQVCGTSQSDGTAP